MKAETLLLLIAAGIVVYFLVNQQPSLTASVPQPSASTTPTYQSLSSQIMAPISVVTPPFIPVGQMSAIYGAYNERSGAI
jgi:hypothetical protein